MNPNALCVKALTASDLMAGFFKIANQVAPQRTVQVNINTNVHGVFFGVTVQGDALEAHPKSVRFAEIIKNAPHELVASTSTLYVDGQPSLGVTYDTTDGIIGELKVDVSKDPALAVPLLHAIRDVFAASPIRTLVPAISDKIDQRAIALREQSVSDLRTEVEKLATFLAELSLRERDYRRTLEEEQSRSIQERVNAIDKEYRDRVAALDAQRAAIESDAAEKERAFQQRVAQFDARESKYVRRENEKRLEKHLSAMESITLSADTTKKRDGIRWPVVVLLCAAGLLAFAMAIKVLLASQTDWHLLAPLSGACITFVLTMIYYIKWNDRWFREHADSEFAAKRYKADILRASWVAELVAEWAAENEDTHFPPELLSAYTCNLFKDTGPSRVSEHPIDHMTALMKRATEIDVGKGTLSIRGEPRNGARAT